MRAVHMFAVFAVATIATRRRCPGDRLEESRRRLGKDRRRIRRRSSLRLSRTDLTVTLDGVTIRPALALGGWVAFKPAHGGAMVMGDLVLLETEINPVMTKLIENGLEITAIHNHMLRSNPATFYMHVGGHGDPVKLATALRTALAESKTPLAPPRPRRPRPPSISTPPSSIRSSAPRGRPTAASISSPCRAATRSARTECKLRPPARWGGHRDQLPADRRRQGGDHRRLRADRRRGEPGDQGVAGERHRGDGDPQPHAHRAAAADLHALLGERRRAQARHAACARRSTRPRARRAERG